MAKLVKLVLIIAAAFVGVGVIASIAVALFFDPNDYRGAIETVVEERTGRELTIEGDISLTVFPWLALEVGRTSLGNAEGFGNDPMISFESARLSVAFLPLVMDKEIRVDTAALEGFVANLAVAANGSNNWEDIGAETEAADEPEPEEEEQGMSVSVEQSFTLDIASIVLAGANITYDDAQAGSRFALTDVNFSTGAVATGRPFEIEAAFGFSAAPAGLSGNVEIAGGLLISEDLSRMVLDDLAVRSSIDGVVSDTAEIRFDARSVAVNMDDEVVELGQIDLAALGLNVSADVAPVSYAGTPAISAAVRVADFSLKELLATLDIEAPETADPNAMQKVSFEAQADVGEETLSLTGLRLVLDDTTMTGNLSVPLTDAGALVFDLRADSITVDNYMAPPVETAETTEEAGDVEIPVDLIRSLQANGTLRLDEAFVGPVRFTAMQLGVNGKDGRLRLNPINASFFDGGYTGDVRIDASGSVPSLSVNENISNVNIASMLDAMYDVQDVTGTINASFVLAGSGPTMNTIASDLDGNMRFELLDGAWQGVDVWHQLRSARALFKREPAPPPRTPVRTEFTSITTAGTVTDGVFRSDDLLAQLPFIRVTGGGTVDILARTIDYSVQARVLENPEFANVASEDELSDFTQALIPIRITGSLSSPSFRPDIEGIFRQEVERAIDQKKDEPKRDLIDRLTGADEQEEGAEGDGADTEEPDPKKELENQLKDKLKDIFPR